MFLKKSIPQLLPVFFVGLLVIASFIDYNFNFCYILFRDGHTVVGIIFVIIYNVLLVIFIICYIMATFTDPGSPPKDVVYVLSENELASYYTTL